MLIPIVATAALAAAFTVELLLVFSSPAPLVALGAVFWCAAPGPSLVSRLLGREPGAASAGLFVGPVVGLALSTLALLLLWGAGLPALLSLLLAPGLVWLLALRGPRSLAGIVRLPRIGRADWLAVVLLLFVVPLVTTMPYAHVAEPMSDGGRAYRAYFTADFVWAMSVSAEIAKGQIPPANPFLSGEGLNYYWLSHLLSGVNYRALQPIGARLEEVILADALGFGVAFLACFYWLARAAGVSAGAAVAGCAAAFLANSYEGIERLLILGDWRLPAESLRNVNIDAVSRWFYQGMPVDGLQRLLLYQPHHLTGYALALVALWSVARATSIRPPAVALIAGILLGAGFLMSTFTAIIVGLAVGIVFVVRVVRERAWRAAIVGAALGAAPVAVAVGLSLALGYVNPAHGSLLTLAYNPVAFHRWPIVLLLNFGPLLLFGLAGLVAWRWSAAAAAPAAALLAAASFFYFFADVPDMGGVWVGWRAGHLLLMAFAVLMGVALDVLWRRGLALRTAGAVVVVALAAAAAPTVIIDVYNAQDIANRASTAMFPWTLILSNAEMAGLAWIREHTPADAIVQVEPRARDASTWAYVPAFAERRMYAGLPISMIPLRPYQLATDNVSFGIFRAPTSKDAWEMAHFLGISYLVVGQPERDRYPDIDRLFATGPAFFGTAFHNDALTVYQVRARTAAAIDP